MDLGFPTVLGKPPADLSNSDNNKRVFFDLKVKHFMEIMDLEEKPSVNQVPWPKPSNIYTFCWQKPAVWSVAWGCGSHT